jgi:hypothetical protein
MFLVSFDRSEVPTHKLLFTAKIFFVLNFSIFMSERSELLVVKWRVNLSYRAGSFEDPVIRLLLMCRN